MDLLPRPHDPSYDPIEVPVLLGNPHAYKYDHQGFSTYPERCGWNTDDLICGDFGGREASDAAAFLQSWLYFAAAAELVAAFQENSEESRWDVEEALVLRSISGSQILCNESLRAAVDKCEEDLNLLKTIEENDSIRPAEMVTRRINRWRKSTMRRVDPILDEMQSSVQCIRRFTVTESTPTLPESVILSIAVLGDLFAERRNVFCVWGTAYQSQLRTVEPTDARPLQPWQKLMGYGMPRQIGSDGSEKFLDWGRFKLISERVINQGWCPSLLAFMDDAVHTSAQVYISDLKTHRRHLSHDACSKVQCHAYGVPPDYEHKHRPDCTRSEQCSLSRLEWGQVQSIIDGGGIPTITISNERNGKFELSLTSNADGAEFVALSHIWADGLGNPGDAAIFKCHLVYLQKIVNDLMQVSEGTYIPFWVDTLCVPQEPPDVRRRAIESMALVYAKACHVLVLDAELQETPYNVYFLEALYRIALSGWATRLWTLQEAVFAKKLSFKFKDGTRNFDDLFNEVVAAQIGASKPQSSFGFSPVLKAAKNVSLLNTSIARSRGSKRLTGLAQALQRRSCKVPSDEAICLATMLDLDLKKILDIPDDRYEDRMAQIWLSQNILPKSIFRVHAPKLVAQNLPWAPASLMGCTATLSSSGMTCSQVNGDVTLECAAFLLTGSTQVITFPAILKPRTFSDDGIFILGMPNPAAKKFSIDKGNFAILVPDIANIYFTDNGRRTFHTILVAVESIEMTDSKMTARYLSAMSIQVYELKLPRDAGKIQNLSNKGYEIEIIVPATERRHADYFGSAFGFTATTNNGLVLEYMRDHTRFIGLKMVPFLRFLDMLWRGSRDRSILDLSPEELLAELQEAVSRHELVAALSAWRSTLMKLSAACGCETIHIYEAAKTLREYAEESTANFLRTALRLRSPSEPILNTADLHSADWEDSDSESASPDKPDLYKLVDEEYRIQNVAAVDWPEILQHCIEIAGSHFDDAVEEVPCIDSLQHTICRHENRWAKLLMSLLVRKMSLVKDLYPVNQQQWLLKRILPTR